MNEIEKIRKTQEFLGRVSLTGAEAVLFVQCLAQLQRIEQQLAAQLAKAAEPPPDPA